MPSPFLSIVRRCVCEHCCPDVSLHGLGRDLWTHSSGTDRRWVCVCVSVCARDDHGERMARKLGDCGFGIGVVLGGWGGRTERQQSEEEGARGTRGPGTRVCFIDAVHRAHCCSLSRRIALLDTFVRLPQMCRAHLFAMQGRHDDRRRCKRHSDPGLVVHECHHSNDPEKQSRSQAVVGCS